MAAADTGRPRSNVSAESYIGSLISLTSKYEIRYEGVLQNINAEESSIGLRNVRSFGTEGRKKDGPQVLPSDKIYEYILFRGSDIKDLHVKSSPPPAQPAPPPLHNDPAIIQSHYPRSTTVSVTMPSGGTGTELAVQSEISRTNFQGNLSLYQPGRGLGPWGVSPALPTGNGSGLGMPMYWQGFYAPSAGLPHLQPPALLHPPPGLQMPQSMQQPLQYPGINVQLPSLPPDLSSGASNLTASSTSNHTMPSYVSEGSELPLISPAISSTGILSPAMLSSTSTPIQAASVATELSQTLPPSGIPVPATNSISCMTSDAAPSSKPEPIVEPISSNVRTASGSPSTYKPITVPQPAAISTSSVRQEDVVAAASLVTPDQLVQSASSSTSSQSSQAISKEPRAKKAAPEPLIKDPTESKEKKIVAEHKEPILSTPLERKAIGASNIQQYPHHNQSSVATNVKMHSHHNDRGRGRGRGHVARPMAKFTEEFDFIAMNEKFNKDEVWGHLGKGKGREGGMNMDDDYDIEEEDCTDSLETEIKPVYVKEDFFDSLSCNALDRGDRNRWTRFSDQLKIDAETFGELSKHRPTSRGSRGGRGFRGARIRGSFNGRGYGYTGRGRYPGRGYHAESWGI